MITLSSLIQYPIKACRELDLESANVERMGLQDDRRMMVKTIDKQTLESSREPLRTLGKYRRHELGDLQAKRHSIERGQDPAGDERRNPFLRTN